MFLTFKTYYNLLGYSSRNRFERYKVEAGTRLECEIIQCPVTNIDCKWIVIKGTLIGAAENILRELVPDLLEIEE